MARISLNYPDTGLTISISVYNRENGDLAFSGTMTEVEGVYKYDFIENPLTDYVYVATAAGYDSMRGVVYRDGGGLTTEEHNKLLSLENSTGIGGFSSQVLQNSINNAKRDIIKKIEEIPSTDLTEINNKLDTIDIAKEEIIDTIKLSEKEVCKDIKSVNKELKEDNVSTRQLIRQKAKKQEEFIQKQLDSEAKTQKMIEDEMEEIEEAFEQVDTEEIQKAIELADKEHEDNIIQALTNL